jgi:hypothetical protein
MGDYESRISVGQGEDQGAQVQESSLVEPEVQCRSTILRPHD